MHRSLNNVYSLQYLQLVVGRLDAVFEQADERRYDGDERVIGALADVTPRRFALLHAW